MVKQRKNLEQIALKKFEEVARKYGYQVFKGQGRHNRLPLEGNTYFQFGDLRVDTKTHHVVIEVESAGGMTNLVKYWYCLEKQLIKKPVILLHVFQQSSKADYASHLSLWHFLWNKMKKALGGRMIATCYTYSALEDIVVAVNEFEKHLR